MLTAISQKQIEKLKKADSTFVNTNSQEYKALFAGLTPLRNLYQDLLLNKNEFRNNLTTQKNNLWQNYVSLMMLGPKKSNYYPLKFRDKENEGTFCLEKNYNNGEVSINYSKDSDNEQKKENIPFGKNIGQEYFQYINSGEKFRYANKKLYQINLKDQEKNPGININSIPEIINLTNEDKNYFSDFRALLDRKNKLIHVFEPINNKLELITKYEKLLTYPIETIDEIFMIDKEDFYEKRNNFYEKIRNEELTPSQIKNLRQGMGFNIGQRLVDKKTSGELRGTPDLMEVMQKLSSTKNKFVPDLTKKDLYSLMSILEFNSDDEKRFYHKQ